MYRPGLSLKTTNASPIWPLNPAPQSPPQTKAPQTPTTTLKAPDRNSPRRRSGPSWVHWPCSRLAILDHISQLKFRGGSISSKLKGGKTTIHSISTETSGCGKQAVFCELAANANSGKVIFSATKVYCEFLAKKCCVFYLECFLKYFCTFPGYTLFCCVFVINLEPADIGSAWFAHPEGPDHEEIQSTGSYKFIAATLLLFFQQFYCQDFVPIRNHL